MVQTMKFLIKNRHWYDSFFKFLLIIQNKMAVCFHKMAVFAHCSKSFLNCFTPYTLLHNWFQSDYMSCPSLSSHLSTFNHPDYLGELYKLWISSLKRDIDMTFFFFKKLYWEFKTKWQYVFTKLLSPHTSVSSFKIVLPCIQFCITGSNLTICPAQLNHLDLITLWLH